MSTEDKDDNPYGPPQILPTGRRPHRMNLHEQWQTWRRGVVLGAIWAALFAMVEGLIAEPLVRNRMFTPDVALKVHRLARETFTLVGFLGPVFTACLHRSVRVGIATFVAFWVVCLPIGLLIWSIARIYDPPLWRRPPRAGGRQCRAEARYFAPEVVSRQRPVQNHRSRVLDRD